MIKLIPALTVALYFIKKVWQQWNIRGALLFSLLLQSFLTLIAPFRITTRKRPLIVFIWCGYLIADAAANFAIGLITNGQRNECGPSGLKESNDLLAFWAPFLLLHLGCPDTITAFALEDNELWLRHMLSLILQAVAALYVFVQSLPGNKLQVPTVLMFIAGVIKYAERIYALYLSNLDRFRDSMLQKPNPGPDYALLMKRYASTREAKLPTKIIMVEEPEKEVREQKIGKLNDLEVLHYAYHFFETFKGLVVDLMFSIHARKESRDFFMERKPKDALRVIEVELNFIYGVFYTKMKVMHSTKGYIFRSMAFGSVLAALGLFHFKAKKTEFDPFNVKITYILLLGAVALEVVAFLMLVFSDWTFASLKDPGPPVLKPVTAILRRFLALKKPRWCKIEHSESGSQEGGAKVLATPFLFRRWSESVSAHNFIRYCLRSSPTTMHEFPSWWKIIFAKTIARIADKLKRKLLSFVRDAGTRIASMKQKLLSNSFVRDAGNRIASMKQKLLSNSFVSNVTRAFCFIPKTIARIADKLKRKLLSFVRDAGTRIASMKQKLLSNSFVSNVTRAFCFIPKTIARIADKLKPKLLSFVRDAGTRIASMKQKLLSNSFVRDAGNRIASMKQKLLSNSFVSNVTRAFCYIPKTIATNKSLKNFLDEMTYVSHEPLTQELWNFIFEELKEKSIFADSPEIAKRISSSRGEWVTSDHGNLSEFVSDEVEYDESLLLWHIATDICYHTDTQKNLKNQKISKLLSDYMFYLLVMRPTLMSSVAGIGKIRFQDTHAEAKRFFERKGLKQNKDKEACEQIVDVNTEAKPVFLKGDRSKSVLFDACRLAKELNKLGLEKKWLVMSKVWVELLSYAATHCRASAHAQQVSRGGELITFVWLLTAHLGLGHYFRTTKLAKIIEGK